MTLAACTTTPTYRTSRQKQRRPSPSGRSRGSFLAGQDMAECRAAAQFLDSQHLPGDVCRALETAIPVAYARPWGRSNTIGGLGDHWLPPRDDEVYAHTGEE